MLVGGATGGGFETLRGDKTHCFITQNRNLTITHKTHNTHPLFLSNVSHNSLHTNKHKFRIRKSTVPGVKAAVDRWCEGGWRLRLVAGRWWVVAAFLDLLDVEFNIQQKAVATKIMNLLVKTTNVQLYTWTW